LDLEKVLSDTEEPWIISGSIYECLLGFNERLCLLSFYDEPRDFISHKQVKDGIAEAF
jgi:hypothetical protein